MNTSSSLQPILDFVDLTVDDLKMIAVGTVLIFGLYFALRRKLFVPMLEHVEHREGVTVGALHTADQMRQKAEALRARYDEALFQTRVEANRERGDVVSKAQSEAQAIIERAEADAAQELQAGRSALGQQIEEAQAKADAEVQALAETLVTRVDAQLTVH
jgi:F0F1-type ATP synthase membrane subunit b/b'